MARRGKGIVIDDSTFQKRAKALARKLKVDEYVFVKEQTGLLARDVAIKTPPYVKFPKLNQKVIATKADEMQGRKAIKGDLLNIAIPVKPATFTWAKRTFGNRRIYDGKEQIGLGLIHSESELKSWHIRNRRSNGRTRRNLERNRYWVKQTIFNKYLKEKYADIGIAKASFAKIGVQLGNNGSVPAWVSRQFGKATGRGRMARVATGPYGLISGKARGLSHVFKHLPRIQRDRLIKAELRLKAIAREASKKAGFKVV